ncbi:MAG TPA: hypothetical protein PKU93_03430 [Candidatus Pacearchaeota archaeon]|nr:hypothetical protein [Candidatus Pacearchaeota archaeon]
MGGRMLDSLIEAKNWLDIARKEKGTSVILDSLSKLENALYEKKVNFEDLSTSPEEIRRLKAKTCKKECLHWLLVLRKRNSLHALRNFEMNRARGNLSYAETGTSNLEIALRKFTAH